MDIFKNIMLKFRFIFLTAIVLAVYGCGGGGVAHLPLRAHPV